MTSEHSKTFRISFRHFYLRDQVAFKKKKMSAEKPPPYPGNPQQPGYAPQPGYPTQQGYPPQQYQAYPPQQPGYPPQGPQYATQPAYPTTTTTTIIQQPAAVVVAPIGFHESPVAMTCPNCQASIVTATDYTTGTLTWLACLGLCIIG